MNSTQTARKSVKQNGNLTGGAVYQPKKSKTGGWQEHFGKAVTKDHSIWQKYIEAAIAHDDNVIEALSRSMDILLVFAGLFSAVVTTFIVQVEPALQTWDTPSHTASILELMFTHQFNTLLSILDPSLILPTLEGYAKENIQYPTVSVMLWYISLDCALLVAGGAACMKQWLLEYRRSNSVHRVPYNRAVHHQERYASLQRWFVPEFGELLGCVLLLDLIPFFVACMFHLSWWRTGSKIFWHFSSGILAIYSAFLTFTIVVGVLVPSSPYITPISNLVKRAPQMAFQKLVNNSCYKVAMLMIFIIAMIAVFVVWKKTVGLDLWLLFLWIAPMVLTIGFGLRNGLKIGRISHFIPIMSLSIGILTVTSLVLVMIHTYVQSKILRVGLPFTLLPPFALVIFGLSHRFSTVKSQRQFPVVALLLSTSGLLLASFMSWNFTFTGSRLIPPISAAIVWASMMILSLACLLQEEVVEEDTREAEALGWLIAQISDKETLHEALACIPGIANTPSRRQALLNHTLQTLTLLINSLVDGPDQQWTLVADGENKKPDVGHGCGMDRESRLMLYVACLAELSLMAIVSKRRPSFFEQVWDRWMSRFVRSWFYNNWYRFLTIPPSNDNFSRELRFHHHWYPWFRSSSPDMLYADLRTLSGHRNAYLRRASRAVLSQLYPSGSSADDILPWLVRHDTRSEENDFFSGHLILIELRMVTMRVIDIYQYSQSLDISVRRYLQRYCDNVLQMWMSENLRRHENVFQEAMLLGYLIMENHSDVLRVTTSGDTTPMKTARCIMSLKRLHDRHREGKEVASAMNAHVQGSFAISLVSATAKYLQLLAKAIHQSDEPTQLDKDWQLAEDSFGTGMKYLEGSLIQLTTQDWPVSVKDQVITALETFYFVNDHANIELLPVDSDCDLGPLMTRLKSRAASSDKAVHDRISAMRTISRVLNKIPEPSKAWSYAVDESAYLLDIISSMAHDESPECRVAALSVLLDTRILHPAATLSEQNSYPEESEEGENVSSPSEDIRLEFLPRYDSDLVALYNDVFKDPSVLLQTLSVPRNSSSKEFISKTISIISVLAHTLPHNSLPSTFMERYKYPKALSLIASHEDDELVSITTRKSALHLFIRFWAWYDLDWQKGEVKVHGDEEVFGGEAYLSEMTRAINLLTNNHVSIELDCISLWTDRAERIHNDIQRAKIHSRCELVVALRNAVAWTDFGRSVEDEREGIFTRLTVLQERCQC